MLMCNKLRIKIEPEEYDATCRALVDMAIESLCRKDGEKDAESLLRILQLLLYGEWEEYTT